MKWTKQLLVSVVLASSYWMCLLPLPIEYSITFFDKLGSIISCQMRDYIRSHCRDSVLLLRSGILVALKIDFIDVKLIVWRTYQVLRDFTLILVVTLPFYFICLLRFTSTHWHAQITRWNTVSIIIIIFLLFFLIIIFFFRRTPSINWFFIIYIMNSAFFNFNVFSFSNRNCSFF